MYRSLKTWRTPLSDHESGRILREAKWPACDHTTWGCSGLGGRQPPQDQIAGAELISIKPPTCVISHTEWRTKWPSSVIMKRKKFVSFTATFLRGGNLQNLPLILMFFSNSRRLGSFLSYVAAARELHLGCFHREGFRKTEHSESVCEHSL